jgi:isopenicillin N synthase-like dioxygenase
MSFRRYKATGATYVDLEGSKDNAEFINISKDDALAYPLVVHVTYPEPVNARMKDTVRPFVEACMEANNTMLDIFNKKLGLPDGTLTSLHSRNETSVSEARCIRVPALPGSTKIAVGAHTDFGRFVQLSLI